MPSAEDIRLRFPAAFPEETYSDEFLDQALADAGLFVDPRLGPKHDLAIIYYAAHLATVASGGAAAAAAGIQSVTAGPVSVTYASGGEAGSGSAETIYLRMYLDLIATIPSRRLPAGRVTWWGGPTW